MSSEVSVLRLPEIKKLTLIQLKLIQYSNLNNLKNLQQVTFASKFRVSIFRISEIATTFIVKHLNDVNFTND